MYDIGRLATAAALISAIGALAGCASTAVSLAEARPIAESEQRLYRRAGPDTAPVVVRRDTGLVGSACATTVYVNGEVAAWIVQGEVATLHMPAGEAIIGAGPSAICGSGLAERDIRVVPGQPIHLRIAKDQNGGTSLYRTSPR